MRCTKRIAQTVLEVHTSYCTLGVKCARGVLCLGQRALKGGNTPWSKCTLLLAVGYPSVANSYRPVAQGYLF